MGQSGSFRANALDAASLKAMENHGQRLDRAGDRRRIREVDALIYDPYGCGLELVKSHAAHIKGKRQNAGASKLALQAFIQFPTDLEMTAANEQMMLDQAVAFVNKTHGGKAVFHARLDRDEAGRHGVDVFYAPTYDKTTSRGTETWVSLSKFGRDLARHRLGKTVKEIKTDKKDPATGKAIWETQLDANGDQIMVWQDSSFFVGRVMQDEWFEHLRDEVGLDWVKRGEPKVSRDADRVEVEEYKVQKEAKKLAGLEAKTATAQTKLDTARQQIAEAKADRDAAQAKADEAEASRRKAQSNLDKTQHKITALKQSEQDVSERLRKRERDYEQRVKNFDEKATIALKEAETHEKRAEDAQRAADVLTERLKTLQASVTRFEGREVSLQASVSDAERDLTDTRRQVASETAKLEKTTQAIRVEEAELETVSDAVAQKKTTIASLQSSNASLKQQMATLRTRLQTLNAA